MKKMKFEQLKWVFLLCSLYLVGCANVKKDPREVFFESLVFKDSSDLKEFVSSDHLAFCTNFKVNIKYPAKDVLESYDTGLKKQGWVRADVDKFSGEWTSYLGPGADNKGTVCIYQLLSAWKENDGKLEVFLRSVYYSKLPSSGNCGAIPDNDLQYVQAQILSLDKNGNAETFK
jgi:hypothetical protein